METRSGLIAYATETGNAFDYAEELGHLLDRLHFCTHVAELDALDTRSLREYDVMLIVVSTTGQGDLPTNGRSFWKSLLRKKLSARYLEGVHFSVFGLGDSSYPRFNWAARKLHKRLAQLGATEFYPRGESDEQHDEGLDAGFVPWSYDLRHQLLTSFPFPKGVHPIPDDRFLEPRWKLSPYSCAANKIQDQEPAIADTFSSLEPSSNTPKARITIEAKQESKSTVTNGFANSDHPLASLKTQDLSLITPQSLKVTLEANQRLTPVEHWQDVRHLVLASESTIDYGPGDVLTIYPNNHADDVGQLLKRMNWVALADLPIHFIQTKASEECNFKPSLPSTLHSSSTTLRELLTSRLDITAIPRRSFFSFVAHFTGDQFQRDRLLEFTKPEYIDELYDYTTRPRRSILEVLQEFESVEVPWQWAASMLPDLRGRQFSIASGGILKQIGGVGTRFELLAAIVKYKTVIKKMREGVCTRYLAALPVGSELDVTLQKGSLTIKQDECRRPIVMIGPGTGVAPMRSLIWERKLWSCNVKETTSVEGSDPIGLSLLLFGCRNEGADYFYREEWEDLKTDMPFEVHAAFSRDQSQKIYVQDLIQRQSQIVYRVLHDENGLIYVCGSSGKMPQAVRSALADVFMKHGKLDQVSASNYLEGMEKDGRYKQETW